jgi:hypothetical protein
MEFTPFPKIPRLSRECIVTEKIDGTNASIAITWQPFMKQKDLVHEALAVEGYVGGDEGVFSVMVGSRNRWITPGKSTDNAGFAAWVHANAEALVSELGEGHHFGEWWGKGIGRGYGLDHRRFSLFNTTRWAGKPLGLCHVVPVLHVGPFETDMLDQCIFDLREVGSKAAPGFMNPEGIVVYHTAANVMFKKTCENDHKAKGQ